MDFKILKVTPFHLTCNFHNLSMLKKLSMQSGKIRVFLIYTERLFSDGMLSILSSEKDIDISGIVEAGKSFYSNFSVQAIDLVILEVVQANALTIDYVEKIKKISSGLPVLLIASTMKKGLTENIIDSGISGFIFKSCNKEVLMNAFSRIISGDRFFNHEVSEMLLNDFRDLNHEDSGFLTYREKQILELLVDGETNHNIAGILRISENTVKTHRRNIMEKFGAKNLLGMVRYAYNENIINPGYSSICEQCQYRLGNWSLFESLTEHSADYFMGKFMRMDPKDSFGLETVT